MRTRLVISKETFEQAVKELYGARKMMWGTWQKLMGMKPPLVRMRMRFPFVHPNPSQMMYEYCTSIVCPATADRDRIVPRVLGSWQCPFRRDGAD